MKKAFLLFLAVSIISLGSCKKDEDDANLLLGKWQMISSSATEDPCLLKSTLEFNEKTLTRVVYDSKCKAYTYTRNYTLNNNTITFAKTESALARDATFKISENKL